ncbi:MAG: hypothetical protein EKK52_06905 [Burkholderiales bacterium]|nr:MAG: hypothetical protein EKK52_06905 [Burkholderiales bacterium]
MMTFFRSLAAACISLLAAASALAQDGAADTEADVYAQMKALQVYVADGSAIILARACNDTIPDFASEFLPRFTHWRATNWKLIALGASLSTQFKDDKGAPMDPTVVGNYAAQKLRSSAPEARRQECNKLLQNFTVNPEASDLH